MMASRLIYGMGREQMVAPRLAAVHAGRRTPWVAIVMTIVIALGLASWSGVRAPGGATALSLLGVATLVLHGRPAGHAHCCAPAVLPLFGLVSSAYLASPWSGHKIEQYRISGAPLTLGGINQRSQRKRRDSETGS